MSRAFRRAFRRVRSIYAAYSNLRPHRSLPLLSTLPVRQRDIIWFNLRLLSETKSGQWGLLAARACLLLIYLVVLVPGIYLFVLVGPLALVPTIPGAIVAYIAAEFAYTRVLFHLNYAAFLKTLPSHCPNCGYDARATDDPFGPLLPLCPECGNRLRDYW